MHENYTYTGECPLTFIFPIVTNSSKTVKSEVLLPVTSCSEFFELRKGTSSILLAPWWSTSLLCGVASTMRILKDCLERRNGTPWSFALSQKITCNTQQVRALFSPLAISYTSLDNTATSLEFTSALSPPKGPSAPYPAIKLWRYQYIFP